LSSGVNHFVEKGYVKSDSKKKEYIIIIRFKHPLVNDKIDYNNLKFILKLRR